MVRTLNVAVLMGGVSSEREVSLRSGAAVARALEGRRHRVTRIEVRSETGAELDGVACDAAFIALHGGFGEDGGIQKILAGRRIPYTGSGPAASRAAMDKLESKRAFVARGVETPPFRVIAQGGSADALEQAARSIGFPLVIKPRAGGSSIGVSVHCDKSTLAEGAAEAFRSGTLALMEKYIAGRELTVGILDGRLLPIIEVRPARVFFDYAAKYEDKLTEYEVSPPLEFRDAAAIQRAALAAHEALGCEGATRVDLIFTPFRSAYVLEVNTIPGMTERSLLPKAASAAGIEFPELCERLVHAALRRKTKSGRWAAAL